MIMTKKITDRKKASWPCNRNKQTKSLGRGPYISDKRQSSRLVKLNEDWAEKTRQHRKDISRLKPIDELHTYEALESVKLASSSSSSSSLLLLLSLLSSLLSSPLASP